MAQQGVGQPRLVRGPGEHAEEQSRPALLHLDRLDPGVERAGAKARLEHVRHELGQQIVDVGPQLDDLAAARDAGGRRPPRARRARRSAGRRARACRPRSRPHPASSRASDRPRSRLAAIAAPVGVTSSPVVSTPTIGSPARIASVAGRRQRRRAVLGSSPRPPPIGSGPQVSRSHAERLAAARTTPQMIDQGVVAAELVQHDVASPRPRGPTPRRRPGGRAPRAHLARTSSGSGASVRIARSASPAGRPLERSTVRTSTCVAAIPERCRPDDLDPTPSRPSARDRLRRERRRGAPASSSAARSMSPARPPDRIEIARRGSRGADLGAPGDARRDRAGAEPVVDPHDREPVGAGTRASR